MKKKKDMNKKGFTMIESLAVIVLMGILFVIAIPSVMRYISKSRTTSLSTALKSSYEACENYMMENSSTQFLSVGGSKVYKIKELVDGGFLEAITDPAKNDVICSDDANSVVKVTRMPDTAGGLANYRYDVRIHCSASGDRYYTFPNDGLMEPAFLAAQKYLDDSNLNAPQTVTISNLVSLGYIDPATFVHTNGSSCNNSAGTVTVTSDGKAFLYKVHLVCGSAVLDAKYSV